MKYELLSDIRIELDEKEAELIRDVLRNYENNYFGNRRIKALGTQLYNQFEQMLQDYKRS
jgi:hypothetical protein